MISLQITQSQLKGYKEELVAKKLARANGGITKAFETKEGWEKILIESFGKVETLEQKEIVEHNRNEKLSQPRRINGERPYLGQHQRRWQDRNGSRRHQQSIGPVNQRIPR